MPWGISRRPPAANSPQTPARRAPNLRDVPSPASTDVCPVPRAVLWEATRACDVVCPVRHCRASRHRDPCELSTIEAMLLMNRARTFGRIHFTLIGGDPRRRPDLEDLVRHGSRLGLDLTLAPCVTAEAIATGEETILVAADGDIRVGTAPAGNVRVDDVVAAYRRAPPVRAARRPAS